MEGIGRANSPAGLRPAGQKDVPKTGTAVRGDNPPEAGRRPPEGRPPAGLRPAGQWRTRIFRAGSTCALKKVNRMRKIMHFPNLFDVGFVHTETTLCASERTVCFQIAHPFHDAEVRVLTKNVELF